MKTLGIIGCGAFTRFMLPYLQPYFKISVWNRSGIKEGWLPEGVEDVPIEEADLRLRGPEKTLTQQMIEEIQERR